MSIATQISRIVNAKAAIKSAINAKGGALTNELIDDYPAAIAALPSGAMDFYKCLAVDTVNHSWTGYKATCVEGAWSIAETVSSGLEYTGYQPRTDNIYSEDATVWVRQLFVSSSETMLLLCHFEDGAADSTQTTAPSVQNQAQIKTTYAKFGTHSLWFNYLNPPSEGGLQIKRLPSLDAFTLEFWEYNTSGAAGGPIIYMPASGSLAAVTMSATTLASTDANYIGNAWFHHAFVREFGSTTVSEYVNGTLIGTLTFGDAFGGRDVVIYCGGAIGSNAYRYMDELAIFNYAKYSSNFTPPATPYDDVLSGINNNVAAREVTVAGCVTAPYANGSDYALVNATATGTSRVWANSFNDCFIKFSDINYTWILSDSDEMYGGTTLANGPSDGEPIGGTWTDSDGTTPVTVSAN